MSDVKTHKDLEIWQRGIRFVEDIYRVTRSFPKEELCGLTSQLRYLSATDLLDEVEVLRRMTLNFIKYQKTKG